MKKGIGLNMLLVLTYILTVGAGLGLAQEKVIINGIDANFPPFAYVDKNGNPDGFDVKSVEWIAKEMGFKVKNQPMDWDGIIPSLNAKKIDMIASGLSVTEERKKQVAFTIPYWIIKQVLVVKSDSNLTPEQVLEDGNKVGVQRGTSEARWIEENLLKNGKKFNLVYYDSAPMAVEDLLNGRIVAAAMNDAPALDAVGKKPVKIIGGFGMPDEEFAYAVRKDDSALLDTLNEGLKKLMASPYWEELKKTFELN